MPMTLSTATSVVYVLPFFSITRCTNNSQGNVLMGDHFVPKLTDFGLSTLHGAGTSTLGTNSGHAGTLRFMAPELFTEGPVQVSFASDMYAFGCVCIEVCVSHSSPPSSSMELTYRSTQISTALYREITIPDLGRFPGDGDADARWSTLSASRRNCDGPGVLGHHRPMLGC